MKLAASFGLVLLMAGLSAQSFAQTNNGAQICAENSSQLNARLVSDGAGGTIVVWEDYRRGEADIYAQRISATGSALWTINGVAVCSSVGAQVNPVVTSDGSGGAVIAWSDQRNGGSDIFAQRINASGAGQWTFNGVALCTITNEQINPAICSDGSGGAVVAWQDLRTGQYDIYTQRVSASGTPLWTGNGVTICDQGSQQQNPVIVSDGSNGGVIVWRDQRTGPDDIYGQRVNGSGVVQWFQNGLAYCAASGTQDAPSTVADGTGGAIATWQDMRSGQSAVYTQRLNGTGVALWTTDGVALCTISGGAQKPVIIGSTSGGAIVCWEDYRNGGSNTDIYAQQIASSGVPQWTGNGVGVCIIGTNQLQPAIATDGANGAVVTWYDFRFGNYDAYAQRLNASGTLLWPIEGVSLSSNTSYQWFPVIVGDGSGGAIVAWRDERYSTAPDVFGQRLTSAGTLAYPDAEYPLLVSVRDVPNDQGGKVKLSWTASNQDLAPFSRIENYWIWRAAPPTLVQMALRAGTSIERLDDLSRLASPPAFVMSTLQGTDYYWEYLTSQPAGHLSAYSYVASTTSDSVASSNPRTAFMVMARTTNGTQWWYSNPDSGYSVDNLPPFAPSQLVAQATTTNVRLSWALNQEADIASYRVYRGTSPGFQPGPSTLQSAQPDTGFVDTNAFGAYYYKVSAVDSHGNESVFATAHPSLPVGVDQGALPGKTWFAQPRPILMTESVTLRFGLAATTATELAVSDITGRRVSTIVVGTLDAGEHTYEWNGADDRGRRVPPGVYLARLVSGGTTLVQRIVTLR